MGNTEPLTYVRGIASAIVIVAIIVGLVGPFAYGVGGEAALEDTLGFALLSSVLFGFLAWGERVRSARGEPSTVLSSVSPFRAALIAGLAVGVSIGVSIGLGQALVGLAHPPNEYVFAFFSFLFLPCAALMRFTKLTKAPDADVRYFLLLMLTISAFVVAASWLETRDAAVVEFNASMSLGMLVGSILGWLLHPVFLAFPELWMYVRRLGLPVAAFVLGYCSIALLFAGFYQAVWRATPAGAFAGSGLNSPPSFVDFLYFSMVTMATLGYGDITPVSTGAKLLVCIELLLQFAWMTVVFAATSGYLQARRPNARVDDTST